MKLLYKDLQPYTLREEQQECSDFIFNTIHKEDFKKFFLLDLPTGIGKSVLALNIIQRYIKEVDRDVNFDIITESKLLQSQYVEEFNSISNLWGRNSYQCSQFNCNCEQGKEFQKVSKTSCDDCPYDKDRDSFMNGKISLTNFHMYTLLRMNKLFDRRESKILIVDEAHQLETVVSDFISIIISQKVLSEVFENSDDILKNMKDIVVIDDFVSYCELTLVKRIEMDITDIEKDIKKTDKQTLSRDLNINDILGVRDETIEISKTKILQKLKSFQSKIHNFLIEYKNDHSNWIIQFDYDEKKRKKLTIQPIWAGPFFDKYIWNRYDRVFLMSGTILNQKIFSYVNGIPDPLTTYYNIPSPFLIKNRPIYYMPRGRMTYKIKKETFKKYIPILNKLFDKYKNKKGIVHTITYELQEWLTNDIINARFITHSPDQKSKNFALKNHYTSPKPTILVSPSMGTGVDLKDKRARFQICLKVPYPNLGDLRMKQRMKDNPEYYAWLTVSKLIQIYGRAIRSEDDYADFIILDSCFSDVLNRSSHMIPDWFLAAIKHVDTKNI